MTRRKHCPLCQGTEGTLIHKKEEASWILCGRCELIYKVVEENGVMADSGYYREGRMRKTVPYRYGDASSVTPEIAFEEKYELQWERFLKVRKYVTKDSSVMEIGCGAGGFLYLMRPMARDCVGVELDRELVDFCRSRLQADVRDQLLGDIDFGDQKFDVICMFHVLEHFRDPKGFLQEVQGHLKPRGILAIEVPCFDEALLQAFDLKGYAGMYFTMHHELYFTQKSLRRLLNDCGLTPRFSPFNEYGLANHLNWLQHDSPVPGASRQSERLFQATCPEEQKSHLKFVSQFNHWFRRVNDEYKGLLAAHGLFDTVFCIAGKDSTS